jgi:UDP-N-acetylmuramoyl-L-alanyl-D-glutamate--2,6-diaminopimelate ligase
MMATVVAAMTLGELVGSAAGAHAGLAVTEIVSDSRQVTPGAAFVALAGERSEGLRFAEQAVAAGAVVVLHEEGAAVPALTVPAVAIAGLRTELGELGRRFYGRAVPDQQRIGITGTNGKTTVAWLVSQALSSLGVRCGYLGTLGYGRPGALATHALTTPDCLALHRELAVLGTPAVAVEVSSHALAQDRIAGLDFPVAAFTNLTRDHLDWHGTMDAYFAAKARLFALPGLRTAVINMGDDYGRALAARLTDAVQLIGVEVMAGADARGVDARRVAIGAQPEYRGLAGQVLEMAGSRDGAARLESPLVGAINAENLLVACGILVAAGQPLEAAAAALGKAQAPPGRLEVFGGPPDRPWVVVDYAHTPVALERVLTELTSIGSGGITCVFGCGGERDRGKRAAMGEAAARYSAHLVLTDDNPRNEDPAAIVADIKAGILRHPDLRVVHDRAQAIGSAIRAARPGAVVLIAGKGHETDQRVGLAIRAFDDRAEVRRVLEDLS